jgi:eukaryotic-like serine/threonine-protein kinase
MLPMPASETICPRCGAGIPAPARFCPACGYAAARLTPGQTLDGKYEILEKIGEGGMGQVYKARHVHLDEIRIIKVTKPDALGEGPDPRRFQEEARMATLVRHPNVAALYDFSRLPDGSYYMVWEFIDGVTLEEWMRRHGPLPLWQALDVARQVLAGLAEIHAQGIVHRDLSPDNILVRENREGRLVAKIIDLGVAKRVAAESLAMTGTGLFLGKLKYCSPEQAGALPEGEVVDGRSDLYSFGIVLYEMLAGRPPFESQTPEGYLGKHLHSTPPPFDTTRLPARTGSALASIVMRALEKKRERRFSSAGDFAAALESLGPVQARPIEMPSSVAAGRGGRTLSLWVAAVLLAVAGTAAFFILHRSASRRSAPPPVPTFAASITPTAAPTNGPDEVVIAPRIVEQRTPGETELRPETPTRPPPTQAPAQAPTQPPPGPTNEAALPGDTGDEPLEGVITAAKLKRFLHQWSSRPLERRARRASDVADAANFWAVTHPDDSYTAELKRWLPQTLKSDTETALGNRQPVLARLSYRAYRQLKFSPPDPDLARSVRHAAP